MIFKRFGQLWTRMGVLSRCALILLAVLILAAGALTAWLFYDLPDVTPLKDATPP